MPQIVRVCHTCFALAAEMNASPLTLQDEVSPARAACGLVRPLVGPDPPPPRLAPSPPAQIEQLFATAILPALSLIEK